MPRNHLFQASLLLAVSGIATAVYGLFAEEFKLLVLGFVFICGAGVFATLYLGTRRVSQASGGSEPQGREPDIAR